MENLKGIVQIIRNVLAMPFLFLGIGSYFAAEFLSGKLYTWRGDAAASAAVKSAFRLHNAGVARKGFRTPPKRGR